MIRSLFAVLLLGAFTLPAFSQKITFRTLCFRTMEGFEDVLIVSGDKALEVPLSRRYSDPLETVVKDGEVTFSVRNEEAGEDDPAYKPVARAKVPSDGKILFVFLPGESGKSLPYRVLALPDDTESFPWGHLRLLNLAGAQARFHLGEFSQDKAITLKPGELKKVGQIRKLNPYKMYNVLVEFETPKKGFVTISNTRWKCVDRKRGLAIAYVDPRTKRPVVELYDDIQEPNLDIPRQ